MIGLVAAATSSIRVGSAGVQLGHRTPLSVVEEFGLLDCAYPGRLDLGIGRTQGTPRRSAPPTEPAPLRLPARLGKPKAGGPRTRRVPPAPVPAGPDRLHLRRPGPQREAHTVDGVLIPSPPPLERLRHSPRLALARDLLQQPEAITPGYTQQIDDILALLRGEYRSLGLEAHATPGEGAGVQLWILGSSGGESAEVAGHTGCASPPTTTSAPPPSWMPCRPTARLFVPAPKSTALTSACRSTSSIADGRGAARRLAAGYGLWVLGIRSGEGAIPFPTHEEAAAHTWTDQRLGARRRPRPDADSRIRTGRGGSAGAAGGGDRSRRARRDHHDPRPHGSDPLLRVARRAWGGS